jgi:hypothetical protein
MPHLFGVTALEGFFFVSRLKNKFCTQADPVSACQSEWPFRALSSLRSLDHSSCTTWRLEPVTLRSIPPDKPLQLLEANADSLIIASSAGRIVGFAMTRADDGPIWLCWFATLPECRKKAIGTRLINWIIARGVHAILTRYGVTHARSISHPTQYLND